LDAARESSSATPGASPGNPPGGPTPQIDLVIDTNVIFDIVTRFDLYRAGVERYGHMARVDPDDEPDPLGVITSLINADPEVQLRMTRMKFGMALLQHLHATKATTYSYVTEIQSRLTAHIPPGSQSMAENEVILFLHHYKDNVFPGWNFGGDAAAPFLEKSAVDQHLVDVASEYGAILISNEGLSHGLVVSKAGIRKRAARKGVQILTTIEYLAQVGGDVRHLAQTTMMRIWYYFDKIYGRVPWGRLREYNILVNWDANG
jgi:hypothetical protein